MFPEFRISCDMDWELLREIPTSQSVKPIDFPPIISPLFCGDGSLLTLGVHQLPNTFFFLRYITVSLILESKIYGPMYVDFRCVFRFHY